MPSNMKMKNEKVSAYQTFLQLAYWQQKEDIKYTENNKPVPVHRRILPTTANIRRQFYRQPDVKTWRGRF